MQITNTIYDMPEDKFEQMRNELKVTLNMTASDQKYVLDIIDKYISFLGE